MIAIDDLSEAIILFLGFDIAKLPQHNMNAVINKFGKPASFSLLAEIHRLIKISLAIEIDWNKNSLAQAGNIVRDEMRRQFPNLSERAAEALAWHFTFNNR